MATQVSTNDSVTIGALPLTTARMINWPAQVAAVDFTNWGDAGFSAFKPGAFSWTAQVESFQDYASGSIDATLNTLGTVYAFTWAPTGGATAGDPCWFSRGNQSEYPVAFTANEAAMVTIGLAGDKPPVRGVVGHPSAARTTTGTGTAIAFAGPTASQRMYAALHVTAYSGLTNAVIKVQSDDAVGFPSATDRVTFTTVTATGSEFTSVAGGWNTETHHRISWTLTGVGSITFVASFGII